MADNELKSLLQGLFSDIPTEPTPREAPPERTVVSEESPDARAQLERHAIHLQTASQVSHAASSILSQDELLPRVVDLIRGQFDLYYVGIFLLDQDQEWATLQAGTGEAGRKMVEQGHRLQVGGDSMIGWCIALQQARIALDVGEEAVHFDNPLLPQTHSEMALPLVSRGHVIGAMTIQSAEPAAFSQEDITAFQTMADQLANAIENARLFEQRERRITELAIINEISQALSTVLTVEDLLEMVHQQVSRLFDTTNFYIATYKEGSEEWTSAFHLEGGERQPSAHYSIQAGLTGHIIRSRQPVLFRTIEDNVAFNEAHGIGLIGELARSWLGVPLIVSDKLAGVMAIQNYKQEYLYDEQDLALFSTIATEVAIALDNLWLLEETQRRAGEMEVINEVGQAISSVLDLNEVLHQIVDVTKERFGHYFVSISLVEGDQLMPRFASTVGDSDTRLTDLGVMIDLLQGPSLVAEAMRSGQPVLVSDVRDDARYLPIAELPDTRAELSVPIEVKGRVIGVLDVQSDQPHAYSQTDVALLQSLASQAGVAIENARLFEQRERRITELAIVNEIGQALSTILTLEDLLEVVHQQVSRLFDTANFYIVTYEEGSEEWTSVFHLEEGQRQPITRYSIQAGLTGHIIRNRQPIFIRSSEEHIAFNRAHGVEVIGEMARSWLGVPLIAADKLTGVMAIQNYEHEYLYDEQDLALFSTIAAQVANALENLRLFAETQARAEQTQRLLAVSEATASTLESTEVMRLVARAAAGALNADTTAAYVFDETGTKLTPVAGYHVPQAQLEMYQQTHFPFKGHTFVEEALTSRRTVFTSDTANDPRYDEELAQFIPARSAVLTPMIVKDAVIGVLWAVWWEEDHHLTDEEQGLVEGIVRQAAIAIDSARQFQQTQQRVQELTMHSEVSQALSAAPLQANEVASLVVRQLVERMKLSEASISLLTPDGDTLQVMADLYLSGEEAVPDTEEESFRLSEYAATARVMESLQPLVVQASDPDADPAELAYMHKYQIETMAIFPLAIKGQTIGVLELEVRDQARHFTPSDLSLLTALANQAAVALENARLFEETRVRAREMEAINELGRIITSMLDLDTLLRQIVDTIKSQFGYYFVSISFIEGDRLVFQDGSTVGDSDVRIEPHSISMDLHQATGLVVEAARTGQPILCSDALNDPRYAHIPEMPDTRSELDVPIAVKGSVIGVLDIQSTRPFAFEQSDVALLQLLAGQAAVALENARLFAQTQARARRERILRQITTRVRTSTDPDTIMRTAVRELGTALDRPAFVRLGDVDVPLPAPTSPTGKDDGQDQAALEGGE